MQFAIYLHFITRKNYWQIPLLVTQKSLCIILYIAAHTFSENIKVFTLINNKNVTIIFCLQNLRGSFQGHKVYSSLIMKKYSEIM